MEESLMSLDFDYFLRYVAPTAYVALKGDEIQGQLIKTFDDCYLVDVQDTVRIPKDGIDIQLWSAYDGKGVVYPKEPGEYCIFASPSDDSAVLGKFAYEAGFVPETLPCIGYSPGWFKVEFGASAAASEPASAAYVKEEEFSWDFANRF